MKNRIRVKKSGSNTGKKLAEKKKSLRKTLRVPGNDKGKIIIMPDFDAPLPEFEN